MIAQWHLLGAVRGYTTLGHSPGLRADERAELESAGFGQTDDPAFRDSLRTRPAALGRLLSSGRYALTRCLPGAADASGRSTLLFASLVFDASDWSSIVSPALTGVLADTALWNRVVSGPPGPIDMPKPTQAPAEFSANAALAILDAWILRSTNPGSLIAVSDTPEHAAAVLSLPRLLPVADRASLAWGVRLLSTSAPVSVATLSAAPDQRRPVVVPRFGQALSHQFPKAVASFWQSGGVFPAAFIAGVESVDRIFPPQDEGRSDAPKSAHKMNPTVLVGAVLLLAVAGGVWLMLAPGSRPVEPASIVPFSPTPADAMAEVIVPSQANAAASRPTMASSLVRASWDARQSWTYEQLAAYIEDARMVLGFCSSGVSGDGLNGIGITSAGAEEIDTQKRHSSGGLVLYERLQKAIAARAWIDAARHEASRMASAEATGADVRSNTVMSPAAAAQRRWLEGSAPEEIATSLVKELRAKFDRQRVTPAPRTGPANDLAPIQGTPAVPAAQPEPMTEVKAEPQKLIPKSPGEKGGTPAQPPASSKDQPNTGVKTGANDKSKPGDKTPK